MAFANVNDTTVHYEMIGDASARKVIVFSNSLGTDFRIWLPLFDELEDDVSILLYDSRGHGLSGLGPSPFMMDDLVDDLIGLVEHVGISKAVFCGLSVGGLIVQGLWRKRPDLVRRMILCDTAPKIGTADVWNARIDAIDKGGLESISQSVMERWFTPAFRTERPEELSGYRLMMERQSINGYVQTCKALRDTDFTDVLPTITVPALFVVGDEDGSTPVDLVRRAADGVPGSRFEVIAECGHIPCVEQPEALARLIRSFTGKP
ncbi:3-oxoadipate enol-lactonase [Ciceribacter sp. L1K23]|uniref:3-oxoadipate enol-lactonase n=1 Tax=Ciceribacter sp. L1K23 TaxID=2820276 RepID=UPI001B83259F|nr:3-oxoadipate enol-lactonase [Ciceribacter sp. L1K23]MBR0557560.1 3-oxoadipate enol-lactonase [Ciceribacter sp. L1K23]